MLSAKIKETCMENIFVQIYGVTTKIRSNWEKTSYEIGDYK